MDKTGAIVIKPAFDDAYPFSEGLAAVEQQNKWGYIDKAGHVVILRELLHEDRLDQKRAS